MHSKLLEFKARLETLKLSIVERANYHIDLLSQQSFTTFSNEIPFKGTTKNAIFFTNSNHYRANLGTWMSVGKIEPSHPHISYEDRGYIKGVVTDLEGYMALKSANALSHSGNEVLYLYIPKTRRGSQNEAKWAKIKADALAQLDAIVLENKTRINFSLKERTGCSLLYYIKSI